MKSNPAFSFGSGGKSETILGRLSSSLQPTFTSPQSTADTAVATFLDGATDPKTLAAMTAGGLAYRIGKVGTLLAASNLGQSGLLPFFVRGSSCLIGFGAETLTFAAVNRGFKILEDQKHTQSFAKDWAHSALTLAPLKIFPALFREQSLPLQHLLTDTGMVAGNHLAYKFHVGEKPEGDLATQFFHAEAMNWQMKAGMGLVQMVTPGFNAFKRSLDLSIQFRERGLVSESDSLIPFAPKLALGHGPSSIPNSEKWTLSQMTSKDGEGGGSGGKQNPEEILRTSGSKEERIEAIKELAKRRDPKLRTLLEGAWQKAESDEEWAEIAIALRKLPSHSPESPNIQGISEDSQKPKPSGKPISLDASNENKGGDLAQVKIFRTPRQKQLLKRLKAIESTLEGQKVKEAESFYDLDGKLNKSEAFNVYAILIPQLAPGDRLIHTLQYEALLKAEEQVEARQYAIEDFLKVIIPSLEPKERLGHVLKIKKYLFEEEEGTDLTPFMDMFFALYDVVPHLERNDRLILAQEFVKSLDAENSWEREVAMGTLREIIPHLEPKERGPLALKVGERLRDQEKDLREIALITVDGLIPYLEDEYQKTLTRKIEEHLDAEKEDNNPKGGPSGPLGTIAGLGIGLSLLLGAENAHAMTKVGEALSQGNHLGTWIGMGLIAGLGVLGMAVRKQSPSKISVPKNTEGTRPRTIKSVKERVEKIIPDAYPYIETKTEIYRETFQDDSLSFLNFVGMLQDEFDINIPDKDAMKLTSARRAITYICRRFNIKK